MLRNALGFFLLPFLKLRRCDVFALVFSCCHFLSWADVTYFCIGIFLLQFLKLKIWDMTYFCIGIFILKTWGDVTYLQTRDDTSIKAPLRRQTICQICHKRSAFIFCRILLGIFHICGDIFFWIKKVWFAWFCWCCFLPSIFSQLHLKRFKSCANEQAESKELHCHCTRL